MEGLVRQIRELFELRDIPAVTEAFIQQLAKDGAQIIQEEARRREGRIPD